MEITEDKNKCSEQVGDGLWNSRQCIRNAKVVRGGKSFCTIHDPEYKKIKENEQERKYRERCCSNCKYYFHNKYYKYCPSCGTKKVL